MNSSLVRILGLTTCVVAVGCASGPTPLPTVAPGAEASIDGLYLMENTVFQLAYMKPDLDLSPYTAFMLGEVEVAYQKEPGVRTMSSADANFALSTRQMENLKEIFRDEVERALTGDGGISMVDEPGPNVAFLKGYLIDLVVRAPMDRGGRNEVYTDSYGEVTLIFEVFDSQSGEILARIGERQDPTGTDFGLAEVNPSFVRSDVTRMFRHWSNLMRERFDQLREAASM
jgi:hypothetical protein